MTRALAPIHELIDFSVDLYKESALCRAICQGVALLAGLLLLDSFAGFPTGTRMAYVLPLWISTKRGGRHAGATLVLLTTISLALIDAAQQERVNGVLVSFVLQTSVLYALMRIFDGVESRLRSVTNLATKDPLTGLYNRLALEERAKKSIDRATVLSQHLSVAMIDCDHFKELNDQFGHAFGDEVLRLLGKTMRRNLPADAIVGRNGGDEFIVVLPNRDRLQALTILEATLDKFTGSTELVGKTTGFSYGVAVVGENGFDYDKLLRTADDDMYRRKAMRAEAVAS